MSDQYDVIVIGAGAAGLLAAASSAGRGKQTLLLEKNRKLGVKILMSGGTRCNITHNCDIRGIIQAFGKQGNFLHSALAAYPPPAILELLHQQDVATKIEDTGKIFPISNKAIDVRDALVRNADQLGAKIQSGIAVDSIEFERHTSTFLIHGPSHQWIANSVIVTTGGKSYPGCGTTGDGYRWAQHFGHQIVPTVPALVPLLSNCSWANELKGITIPQAEVKIWAPHEHRETNKGKPKKRRPLARQTGSFLFTHWGFSGPSVLDVSRAVAQHPQKNSLEIECDFLPDSSATDLAASIQQRQQRDGKQIVGNLLTDSFPKRLSDALLESADIQRETRNAELSSSSRLRLVDQIKRCRFPISGTLGFEKAEVTAGGVSLAEVDSRTMESKLQPGLFFAGEILDLDGRIGGFNFQGAFSTGWLAGQSA